MFKSALLRLTVGYLAFIMLLSLVFSGLLYRLSLNELQRDFHQRVVTLQQSPFRNAPGVQELIALRTEQIEESRDHFRRELLTINLIILLIGGGLAYLLAKRNLAPIEEAHRAQTRFTADASHELRTPLAAMRSEIEVTLRDTKLNLVAAKRQLASNLEEIAKLEQLSSGLLQLARQEHHIGNAASIDLVQITEEVIKSLAMLAKRQKIELQPVLPAEPLFVRGDGWSLQELITILLDNALKYSQAATVVTISLKKQGSLAELAVHDRGFGIKPSDLPHIFDRFYRADQARSKEKVSGYGLGLAIAKQIVEAHRGTIVATSTPSLGTIFTVRLPVL